MTLNDEEVAVITKYRQQRELELYENKQAEIRASCEHNYFFDFINYKTTYYKCSKCGQGKAK